MPEGDRTNAATRKHREGMTLPFLESASFWSNVAVVAFTILAAMAAVFALYFGSRLSAAKDADLERFKTESAKVIASADARAAEANKRAAEAGEGTAKALSEAASANERARKLELEAAQQRERAAKAERELLTVQERIRPRLTDEQRARLLETLRNGPVGKVTVQAVLNDSGAMSLAFALVRVFREAGWRAGDPGFNAVTVFGVHMVVQVRDAQKATPQVAQLVKGLRAIGLSVGAESKGDMAADDCRPNPAF